MPNCRRLRFVLTLTLCAWALLPQATRADAAGTQPARTPSHKRAARNAAGSVKPVKRARTPSHNAAGGIQSVEAAEPAVAHDLPAPQARSHGARWSADDEIWYTRNRRIRIATGVLTALGAVLLIAGGVAGATSENDSNDAAAAMIAGVVLYGGGSIALAASSLYGANEMRRRGKSVSKVPGILSVVGIFGPPILWIAAPMQGANLRRAHDEVAPRLGSTSGKTLGLTFRAEF